ncbi:hypothetical protein MRX96_043047 [Rhipicephalus microplus]
MLFVLLFAVVLMVFGVVVFYKARASGRELWNRKTGRERVSPKKSRDASAAVLRSSSSLRRVLGGGNRSPTAAAPWLFVDLCVRWLRHVLSPHDPEDPSESFFRPCIKISYTGSRHALVGCRLLPCILALLGSALACLSIATHVRLRKTSQK